MPSQYVDGNTKTFIANAALGKYLRVKLSTGELVAAGATELELGTLEEAAIAADDLAAVRLLTASGTCMVVAAGAVSQGAALYTAASGKVNDVYVEGCYFIGYALEAAGADGDVIEMLRVPAQVPMKAGSYTAIAADATANTTSIATGLSSINTFAVQILRSGVPIHTDQAVSASSGSLVVADGGATYVLTTGDVIKWWAVGAL